MPREQEEKRVGYLRAWSLSLLWGSERLPGLFLQRDSSSIQSAHSWVILQREKAYLRSCSLDGTIDCSQNCDTTPMSSWLDEYVFEISLKVWWKKPVNLESYKGERIMFEVYTILYGQWALPFVLSSIIYNTVCLLRSGKNKSKAWYTSRVYDTASWSAVERSLAGGTLWP